MKTTAIVPWFGAKRKMAHHIVKALGPHSWYIEPFCGSCAVLFEKEPATMETVNDLHGDLINLARMIRDDATWDHLREMLRRTLVGPAMWEDSARVIKEQPFEPSLERAAHYFTYCWQGRNGSAGSTAGQNFCMRYTSNGGSPGTRFKSTVDSIEDWHERLRAVVILNEDAFAMLERIEDKTGTVIYCDPPYLLKGQKYTHDFAVADHARLAKLLSRFRATRVVVSYYEHPELVRLYPGWAKQTIEVTKGLGQSGQRGKSGASKAKEVLLVNQGGEGLFD